MAFPALFLGELKMRLGLADVIGRRVKLVKKGREWHGLCPFHKEKTPSFTVNEDKGFYHCFGCGEHGSVFDFVMKTENLSFPEAVEALAAHAGMAVPQDSPEERRRAERRRTLEDVSEAACTWFERSLRMPEGRAALDYLKGRGVDDATIKRYRLGFAPDSRGALKAALAHDGFDENLMVEAGLLIRPPEDRTDRTPYDRFRGRVMFPILDRRGRVIAFGGRILGDGEPKYLNSPETPLFHKGRVLYGLHLAAPAARKAGRVIVTEGYMDVIALAMAGFEEAVAPLGTALTEDHLRELWRIAPEPVLCFDGDEAGRRAAARAAERALPLLNSGHGLRFAELPAGEDPDTLVRGRGREALEGVLDAALPLSEVLWLIETGGQVPSTPEGRAGLQKRLGDHVRRIADPTVRRHFGQAFNERLWRRHDRGRPEGRRGGGWNDRGGRPNERGRGVRAGGVTVGVPLARCSTSDPERRRREVLLATLIGHPALYDAVGERLGSLEFEGGSLDNLRQEVLKTLAQDSGLDFQGLVNHLRGCGYSGALDALLGAEVLGDAYFARPDADLEDARAGWEETFHRLQGRDLETEIREAERALAENFTEEAFERLRALKQQEHLQTGNP